MKAYKDTQCRLCDKEIKEGNNIEVLSIHGRYHDVCMLCWNQIYYKVADIIIKKIKE